MLQARQAWAFAESKGLGEALPAQACCGNSKGFLSAPAKGLTGWIRADGNPPGSGMQFSLEQIPKRWWRAELLLSP